MSFTVTPLERREGRSVFFCKKEGFEFSHSPEHAFTSGAIYCLKAEIFWASPFSSCAQRYSKEQRLEKNR